MQSFYCSRLFITQWQASPPSPKQARTFRNRRLHYFIFLDDLGIIDDLTLENQPQERANLQLARMYASTHLATGSTILCQTVKASTIRAYLGTVAKFLGRFRAIDPRFVTSGDKKLAPAISMVIAEQERWETVPNRRKPFTLELQATLAAFDDIADNPCGLNAAMLNWTMCNLYAGFRGIEWAQTNCTHRHLSTYHCVLLVCEVSVIGTVLRALVCFILYTRTWYSVLYSAHGIRHIWP